MLKVDKIQGERVTHGFNPCRIWTASVFFINIILYHVVNMKYLQLA